MKCEFIQVVENLHHSGGTLTVLYFAVGNIRQDILGKLLIKHSETEIGTIVTGWKPITSLDGII